MPSTPPLTLWRFTLKITSIRLEPHDSSVWAESGLLRSDLRVMLNDHKATGKPNPLFDFPDRTITTVFDVNDECVFVRTRRRGHTTITLSNHDDYSRFFSTDRQALKELYALSCLKGT